MQYPTEPAVVKGELPDPFLWSDGTRVTSREQWPERARMWRDLVVDLEYGGIPPAPESVEVETLCHSRVRRWPGSPLLFSYRIHCPGGERSFSFCVRIVLPEAPAPIPAMVT